MSSRLSFALQATVGLAALAAAFQAGRMTMGETAYPAGARGQSAETASRPKTAERPARAVREVPTLSDSAQNTVGTRSALADTAVSLEPDEATERLKSILANPDPLTRMDDYLAYLKTLKSNEARQAALTQLMQNFDFRTQGRELTLLMSAWAQSDPQTALAAAQEHKGQMGQHTTGLVLSQWATKAPDEAIAWATENGKKMNETGEGNWYMVSVLGSLAKNDLDRAATLLPTAMNRSQARGEALDRVLDEMFKQRGAAAGQAWVASLPEGSLRAGATERVATRMADQDGPGAAAWASAMPESETKTRALVAVVDQWADNNPGEAGIWLNQLPMDATTDAPRERFVWKVAEEDPAAAVSWAGTITDEKRRSRTTGAVLQNWVQNEPDQARAWIAASDLPEDVKQRFARKPKSAVQ